MKRILIAAFIVSAGIASAYAGGNMLLHVGQADSNGTAPPLTNLRITNTGDFRITNTGDNRAVFP
jgi:hypothetical protein